ncbi:hypothetical protein ACSZND_00070 [Aeromonas hydrophila]|uniref:hypothetical protein n=1 Tax=Aeromonas TaxID=642 RepID=UPI00111B8A3B|nr:MULTISPECIES: hypothetical protein [Aeromonas]MBM0511403.1 hypothetical protein [Aeromonas hydrophila]MBW3770989.1 hypothetical protein [Aeromonas hydrophila]MCX4103555.1 hypothetical protein [Aeromonas hydrophila]TNJ17226.1 hypothetical protein CF112_19730 [Aeromonas hydrophila]
MDIVDCWKELFDISRSCTTYNFFKERKKRVELFAVLGILMAVLSLMLWFMPSASGNKGVLYNYIYVATALVFLFLLNAHVRHRIGILRFGKNSFTLKDAEMYAKLEMFKRKYEASDRLKGVDICTLIEWGENRMKQPHNIEGIISKLIPAVFTVVAAYLLGLEKSKEWAGYIIDMVILIAPLVMPYMVAFKELSLSVNNRYFMVCQNLKWIEIEGKTSTTHFELNSGPR